MSCNAIVWNGTLILDMVYSNIAIIMEINTIKIYLTRCRDHLLLQQLSKYAQSDLDCIAYTLGIITVVL